MKKFTFAALILILGLSACTSQRPITSNKSENNQTYTVAYLFEHDGCKVYRFVDGGNTVYFTSCNGEAISKTDSTETRNSTQIIKTKP